MPNDTIWATAITGVVGLGGMLSTGLTALRLERRRLQAEDEHVRQQDGRERARSEAAPTIGRSSSCTASTAWPPAIHPTRPS